MENKMPINTRIISDNNCALISLKVNRKHDLDYRVFMLPDGINSENKKKSEELSKK